MKQPSYTFNFSYRQSPPGSDRGSWNASFNSDFSQADHCPIASSPQTSSILQPRGYVEGVEDIDDTPVVTMGDHRSSTLGSNHDGDDSEYHCDWYGYNTPSNAGSTDRESSPRFDDYPSQPGDPQMSNYHGEGPSYTEGAHKSPYTGNPADEVHPHEAPIYTPEGQRPVVAVMGRTGSGKTSFIKSIAGDKAKHLVIGKNLHSCTF